MPWLWGRRLPRRPFSSETHEGKNERKQKKEARSNGLFLDKVFLANETEFIIDKTRLLKKKMRSAEEPASGALRAQQHGAVMLRPGHGARPRALGHGAAAGSLN
jgi:hypothetical protein